MFDNVFVLGTGRCGTASFIEACKHITNYTSGHETLSRVLGRERFMYPAKHIEADNRLSWLLGQLNFFYGDDAFYIHLKRDPEKVAYSFMKRFKGRGSIIRAYAEGVKKTPPRRFSKDEKLQICHDYINTITSNIDFFLKDKPNHMVMQLEHIETTFPLFWERIGAEGSIEAALSEFSTAYNAS